MSYRITDHCARGTAVAERNYMRTTLWNFTLSHVGRGVYNEAAATGMHLRNADDPGNRYRLTQP